MKVPPFARGAPAVAQPAALPGVMPKTPRSFLNEMAGTILAVDNDADTVRITDLVQGGAPSSDAKTTNPWPVSDEMVRIQNEATSKSFFRTGCVSQQRARISYKAAL